jgi:hypothetical protein
VSREAPKPPEQVFAGIARSATYGRRSFPTRSDYVDAYAASVGKASDPLADPDFVRAAARDWHTRGQTGCLFARRLSAISDQTKWPSVVYSASSPAAFADELSASLEAELAAALDAPACEILSLLFPFVETIADLRRLCLLVSAHSAIRSTEWETEDGFSITAMRLALSDEGPLSWIMAFGPFPDWPPTRRAPILELAIRVKPKPDGLFYKLNQDHDLAHLADSDPSLNPEQFAKVFDRTGKATRDVLGAAPDRRSAAKATFSFPTRLWLPSSRPDGDG